MDVRLAYGKQGLNLHLPNEWDITRIEPKYVPGLSDESLALEQALRAPIHSAPLRERARSGDRVAIAFSDITRPTPNRVLLPAVLAELDHLPPINITLFNALGTHRPNTPTELRQMLGDELVDRYRIVQNDAFDPTTQVAVGRSSYGHEIWLNREFFECDLKILTGFIEPHFFAGFSGDGKAVLPGMAGQECVLANHDAQMIAHPKATWGVIQGNPIHDEIREAAAMAGSLFLVNVTLNKRKQITGVFAGDLLAAHACGCDFVRQTAMVAVDHPYDIVITTNSGYPLDLNLYQAVKGMSAAAQIVRPGGSILIAAECWDGIPDHGLYGELLRSAGSPQEVLQTILTPGFLKQDQWQVQIQAQIQLKADVYVYADKLSDEQIRMALFQPSRDLTASVAQIRAQNGSEASICVLPEGPQTIPYLAL